MQGRGFTNFDRSHALRGNASTDALRSAFDLGRRASRAAFPRRAWERSAKKGDPKVAFF
ncbi:hypothetical protein DBV33_22095 [Pseudomonas fluorescens]|nr:hypothetical protein DBV33_22095 [Pseudomonas fluorescens]